MDQRLLKTSGGQLIKLFILALHSHLTGYTHTNTHTHTHTHDLSSLFSHSYSVAAAAAAKSLQSCLTLCDSIDCSPPGSSVPGILQARILEWVAISFSNACMLTQSLQLCPTPCDPVDSSPPGSSVHRIL